MYDVSRIKFDNLRNEVYKEIRYNCETEVYYVIAAKIHDMIVEIYRADISFCLTFLLMEQKVY